MKNSNEIYVEMKAEMERKTGVQINDGGDMALRLNAVASELSSLWTQVDWTKMQSFPQTAIGEFLDKHAQMRGLTRGGGSSASGVMRFEIDGVASRGLIVPKGTVCLNSAGLEFLTTEAGEIAVGQSFCLVGAKARDVGSFGNVPTESVSLMAIAPMGIWRCFNPAAFLGGTDAESDERLRTRVLNSFSSLPNGSNVAYYEKAALEMEGVSAVCVVPRARGIGTVDIIISSHGGLPAAELVLALKTKLSAQREICVDVGVLAPSKLTVPVSVEVEHGRGVDAIALKTRVQEAIAALFDGKLLGKNLLLAQIGNVVYGVEGVLNYKILLPTDDISVAYNKIAVAGDITVTGAD